MAAGATFFAQRKSKRHSAGHEAASIARRHGSAAGHHYLARQNLAAPLPTASTQVQQYGREHRREQARARRAQAMHVQAQRLYKQGRRVEALALNAQARELVGLGPTESPGIVGQTIERAGADIGRAAYSAPGAAIVTGKAVGQDVGAASRGDVSFKHSRALAKAIAESTYQDVRHPLRHPGFTALDLFAIASAGAGTAARVGGASRALSEGAGLRAALRRPAPGEIDLPGGAQALEHDNPLLNIGKRVRVRRITRAIESGRKQAPEALLPGRLGKEFTAQSVVGRENRAREIVQSDIANARRVGVADRLEKLSPAEHTAMRVMFVEGRHARRFPEETVQRHIDTHERIAAEADARVQKLQKQLETKRATYKESSIRRAEQRIGRERNNATVNREVATDLRQALPVLTNPSPDFLKAVESARRFQHHEEKALRVAGHLSPEASVTSKATAAEFYGRQPGVAPHGSVYFPTGPQFVYPSKALRGGPVKRVAGRFGFGEPQTGRYLQGTMRRRTGEGMRFGVVQRPGEAQLTRATGVARLESVNRSYQQLVRLSTPKRVGEHDIEIRRGGITPEMRQRVAAEAEAAAHGDATALGRLKDALKPLPGERSRFVDERYIKDFANSAVTIPGVRGINKPFRFGGVYLRPAYLVTNRPQNFIMRHLAQGLGRSKGKLAPTVKGMREELGPDISAVLDGMGGETRTHSFEPTRGVGQREQQIVEWIQNRTDKNERFLAVVARAYQKGYRTPEDFARLTARNVSQKVENDRIAIARRARKDMVDFSVTPTERTLSDIIYFYPWLSRGSVWAGRFVAEHPVKSAALAQLGRESQREGIGIPGPIPRWLRGQISTRFGLVNPSPLNTFSTPAQIADAFTNPATARSIGEEFGTPAVQALTTEPKRVPQRIVSSLAPLSFAQRFGVLGKPSKTFPDTGWYPAVSRFVAGGLAPQHADVEQIRKQAYAELPSPERFQAKMGDLRKTFKTELKDRGLGLPEQLRNQIELHERRYGAYKKAGVKSGTPDYQQKALAVDLKLLEQMGEIDTDIRERWLTAAKKMTSDQISKQRRQIGEEYFPTDWLNATAKAFDVKVPY